MLTVTKVHRCLRLITGGKSPLTQSMDDYLAYVYRNAARVRDETAQAKAARAKAGSWNPTPEELAEVLEQGPTWPFRAAYPPELPPGLEFMFFI